VTGQSSTRSRCLLDRPVKPGDDGKVWRPDHKRSGAHRQSNIPFTCRPMVIRGWTE
jgi:hypothetical protein